MNRTEANEILYLLKVGAEAFPVSVVNQALRATGDLGPINLARREAASPVRNELLPPPPGIWRSNLAGGNSDAILAK
jgi:hypothetical protein